jgi:hypothetical protein
MNCDLMMSDSTKRRIRAWARVKYFLMSDREYGDDWWHAYNDDWDVNIFTRDDEVLVTAYPMYTNDTGWLETDMTDWVSLGRIATISGGRIWPFRNNKEEDQ